ncbi:hypothetical protein Vqi01_55330 [Micromonospora qiuiae]|uniref:Uncharacterized protein n=1 Tax=Micromonospora qiuiae TaxID=502268 RepID=A0ABQ4JLE0_9ACTN|nr:hypothetical protein [Micromonospora qiuiae]GIJ30371.1 hypothetical protein Vqi01_55330 [Micromonospora qiuiae]
MADEIRQEFARLAEPVVPGPEPYQRLLARVRRRRQRRMAVTGVAGLAAVAMALPMAGAAGRLGITGVASSPPPAAGEYQPASPIDEPMVRQLLDSPTRGNLAGDEALIADIERQYRAARAELLVDPTLDEVRVLLAHDAPGARIVMVAFLDDSHALLRHASGQAGASVSELLRKTGTPDEPAPLEPYVFLGRQSPVDGRHVADLAVGLAPAGCLVETSADGRIQPDGSVVRSWQVVGTDGFVVRGEDRLAERWRFTCQGVVRYAGPAGGGLGVVRYAGPAGGGLGAVSPTGAAPPVSTAGARGSVDAALAATAVRDLQGLLDLHGLAAPAPQVIWGGRLPDWVPGGPAAVLVKSCSTDGGCATVLKTEAPAPQPEPGPPADYQTATGSPDLVVVQTPGETGGVLVVGPESAARVELLDGKERTIATGQLDAGVGALRVDPRQVVKVKVFDTDGRLLRTEATPSLRAGSGQLGEPTVWAW